jgi:hypothetical protein
MSKWRLMFPVLLALALVGAQGCKRDKSSKDKNTKKGAAPLRLMPKAGGLDIPGLRLKGLQQSQSMLVPTPSEVIASLKRLGVTKEVTSLINKDRVDLKKARGEGAALILGVAVADILLTIPQTPPAKVTQHTRELRQAAGQAKLLPADTLKRVDRLIKKMEEKGKSSKKLVKFLDMVRSRFLQEIGKKGAKGTMTPQSKKYYAALLQAGGWLRASNIVAQIALQKGKFGNRIRSLICRPEVLDYFVKTLKSGPAWTSKKPLLVQTRQILTFLQKISQKPALSKGEFQQIATKTGQWLKLFTQAGS